MTNCRGMTLSVSQINPLIDLFASLNFEAVPVQVDWMLAGARVAKYRGGRFPPP
jgi:hypothetical protein